MPQCIHGFSTQRTSLSAVRTPCFNGELGVHDDGDPLNEEERGQWKGKYPHEKSDESARYPSFTSTVVYEDRGDRGAASHEAVWKGGLNL